MSASVRSGCDAFSAALSVLLCNSLVEVMEALETLLVYTRNLILYPDEKKYRKIKISNIHYQERLGHLPGAIDAMTAIGYLPVGDYLRLDERRMSEQDNVALLRRLESIVSEQLATVKKGWQELPARHDDRHHYSSVQGAGSYSAIGKRHNMEVRHTAAQPHSPQLLRAAHRRLHCLSPPAVRTTRSSWTASAAWPARATSACTTVTAGAPPSTSW